MTTTTKSRSLQKAYPPDFTHLVAEVTDTAMKAIIEPDPTRYIQGAALDVALEIKCLRSHLTPERRRDPTLAAALRCDVVRSRVIRDLATEIVEAYERLRRAENKVMQTAKNTVHEGSERNHIHDARRDHMSPVPA